MENGYENFVDTLRQSLLKETSYEEEMICYKKAEEYPPTSGDRLLLKNRQKEGVYEVCALYVRDLYDEFQNGWSMENIIQEIMKRLDMLARSECFFILMLVLHPSSSPIRAYNTSAISPTVRKIAFFSSSRYLTTFIRRINRSPFTFSLLSRFLLFSKHS